MLSRPSYTYGYGSYFLSDKTKINCQHRINFLFNLFQKVVQSHLSTKTAKTRNGYVFPDPTHTAISSWAGLAKTIYSPPGDMRQNHTRHTCLDLYRQYQMRNRGEKQIGETDFHLNLCSRMFFCCLPYKILFVKKRCLFSSPGFLMETGPAT